MLLTKLHIPSPGNNLIHRSGLFERLNEGLHRKLILVSAPAGFGKTTLLSDWINQQKIPAAWFSIDKGDNDPVEFLSYIISGIQNINNEFGKSTLKLLQTPNKPSIESITSLLINDLLNIKKNFFLVLDDFHLIENNEITGITSYLLEHIPGNIHIVILTRSDPVLQVARLRSQNQLIEIRSSELSFSANEISMLFNKKLKICLSIEDVHSLESKTEGWIAGLQLTALSMQGRNDVSEFIKDLKGDNRYIMDYLIEEVLRIQEDDIKDFLLQTSILEQMSAPLCNYVLNINNSQLTLEKLEKNNMFVIPLDTDRNWYRYHHLFAQLLKQRLQISNSTVVSGIHKRAIKWFGKNGMVNLAISHAFEIKDYEEAIQLINNVAGFMWENGQHSAILKYGELLPDDLIKKNADFCLYYAWILIISGQIQKAEPYLTSAENITRERIVDFSLAEEEQKRNKKLLGKISVAFAYMNSFYSLPAKTFEYCKTAMENLSEDDPLWFSWGWYAIAVSEMAVENFNKSISAYETALEYGKKSGNVFLISTIAMNLAYIETRMGLYKSAYKKCSDLIKLMNENGYSQITKSEFSYAALYSCMAGIESMRTDFGEALKNIDIAYNISKNDSNSSFKLVIIMVYSLTLYGIGDTAGATEMVKRAEEIIKMNKIAPGAMAIYIAMKGFLLIDQNDLEKANTFFEEKGLSPDNKFSYSEDRAYFPYTYLLILESRFEDAEKILIRLNNMAKTANRIETLIDVNILYAFYYQATGKKERALSNLLEAFEFAIEDNIIMGFVFYADKISGLLAEVYKMQSASKTKIPNTLVEKLKLAIEKKAKYKRPAMETDLSERELETLKLISDNLTNQEIADKLFISLNTVKTHLKNIFSKLSVDNRKRAVKKAKEIGLIR